MANQYPILTDTSNGTIKLVLDTAEVVPLGFADETRVSQWVLQVQVSGSGAQIIPKQRVIGSGLTGASLATCVYYESDGETAIAAGVATTAAGIYYIPSDGLDTFLDFDPGASGVMTIYARPLKG